MARSELSGSCVQGLHRLQPAGTEAYEMAEVQAQCKQLCAWSAATNRAVSYFSTPGQNMGSVQLIHPPEVMSSAC